MKWTLPLVIGATVAACLTYLHLAPAPCDCPNCVEATASTTWPCYVISEGNALGDSVKSVPVSGATTVCEVLNGACDVNTLADKDIWVSRARFDETSSDDVLPVRFLDITQRNDPATNYELQPYDRIFIKARPQEEN